jgi:hypothetical protein
MPGNASCHRGRPFQNKIFACRLKRLITLRMHIELGIDAAPLLGRRRHFFIDQSIYNGLCCLFTTLGRLILHAARPLSSRCATGKLGLGFMMACPAPTGVIPYME